MASELRRLLGLSITWLCLWGCQGGGTSDASISEFAKYYSDSSMWCEHQVACNLTTEAECENNWPSMRDTETALELAEMTRDQLAKCKRSSIAYDECYLSASCEEIETAGATIACEAELERFSLDCAGLLDAFTMVNIGAEPSGDGDGDAPVISDSGVATGEELCDLSTECTGEPIAEARAECVQEVGAAFSIVPDPDGVLACIRGLSCAQLEAQGTTMCLNIDTAATTCADDVSLNLCNGDGVCVVRDCDEACAMQGFSSLGCGFSEMEGFDQCQCSA